MAEVGLTSSKEKTNDLESELLIAQRKELQDELRGIEGRLNQADMSGTDSQVENLQSARDARDAIVDRIDLIDQLLEEQNPDVLSAQAANLPSVASKTEPYIAPLDPREFHEEDLPLANLSDYLGEREGTEARNEVQNVSEAEDPLIAELDKELLSLTQEAVKIIQNFEDKRADLETQKNKDLEPINDRKSELLNYKAMLLRKSRELERAKEDIKNKLSPEKN